MKAPRIQMACKAREREHNSNFYIKNSSVVGVQPNTSLVLHNPVSVRQIRDVNMSNAALLVFRRMSKRNMKCENGV